MVDGIEAVRGHDEATKIVVKARDLFQHDNDPVISAARRVIRDHERDPNDGTMRVFGGRDEGQLISAVSRIALDARDPAEIEGRLKADVAIQRMGAKREADLNKGHRVASKFEARDLAAVHGNVLGVATEQSRFSSGALAIGRFQGAHVEMREWIQSAVGFAGRQAASEADRVYARQSGMARVSDIIAQPRTPAESGLVSVAKGPAHVAPAAAMSMYRGGGQGR